MKTKPALLLSVALLCITARAADVREADFPTLTIGWQTFTNVHLRVYSATEGSLRHDGGLEKIQLSDLPEPARSRFYDAERVKLAQAKVAPAPKKEGISAEYAGRINAFADKFDMRIEEVIRWNYVLPKRGLSLADFDQALTNLDKARDKALGYHPDIPKKNKNGRRLKAGEPLAAQSPEVSTKEEEVARMLKLSGYP